jgi:signal transduction histidine kinase
MMWPRRLATAAAVLTAAMFVLAGVLAAVAQTQAAVLNLVVGLTVAPLAVTLGVFTARRPQGRVVGALLAAVGLTTSITVTCEIAWQVLAGRPALAESLNWLVAALIEGAFWVLVAVALLLLYFPDGRLPSRRWRWVPPALVGGMFLNQVYGAVEPAPFRSPLEDVERPFPPPPFWFELFAVIAFFLMLALILACAASLVVRYRRSERVKRQQISWLAIGGFGVVIYPFLCLLEILVWGRPLWMSAAVGVTALVGIPVATAIAILRHDLYDVDKALAGAVTWGLVTIVLLAVYAASSLAAGVFLGQESPVAAAAATAVCALALSPLRHRLQRRVDVRLYPLRRAAFAAIDGLHHDAAAGRATPEQLQPVLRTALRDPGLRVGFRVPGTDGCVDADGAPVPEESGEPVVLGGTTIGVLVPDAGEASSELLREVASRAATIAEMVRLRLELARTLREVESSRARLVQIGYDERRRLERDLHDGAQQRLVSLGMAIRVAQRHLDDGTVDVNGLLDQSVAELGTAVAELRQIAHGIRPSSLDDGLPAAVARLVRNVPITIDLEVDDSQLPDDVATTAYFVISESLANAVKHSEATRIGLHVSRLNGQVVVRVSDDGRGGAELRPESGLADRVAALGGSLAVVSPAGRGTVVEAALPCVS